MGAKCVGESRAGNMERKMVDSPPKSAQIGPTLVESVPDLVAVGSGDPVGSLHLTGCDPP